MAQMTTTKPTFNPACTCPGCSLWLRLEAERLDTSYRTPKRPQEPEIVYVDRIIEKVIEIPVDRIVERIVEIPVLDADREDLNRIYFNAGRYSAGAKDQAATNAFAKVTELETKETNER